MLVGSAPSELKLGTTTVTGVRRGAGLIYDSDVAAFQKASGAAQVGPLLALVDYLKAESLWDYARFYPMKSAQNAGSGSTVYGLGGLTSNNMTLVNSPTWGSDGVTFDAASSQCGRISDFLGGGTLAAFWRGSNAVNDSPGICQYDFGSNERAFALARGQTGTASIRRSQTGSLTETYSAADSFPAGEVTLSGYWIEGGGRSVWQGKAEQSISNAGSEVLFRRNNSVDVTVGAYLNAGSPGPFASGTFVFAGVIETAITTTQRETITDLINAL